MITASIFEAKTNLSNLVKHAQKGEVVTITSGRAKTPVARLEAIQPIAKKRLGVLETPGFVLSEREGFARHLHRYLGYAGAFLP